MICLVDLCQLIILITLEFRIQYKDEWLCVCNLNVITQRYDSFYFGFSFFIFFGNLLNYLSRYNYL